MIETIKVLGWPVAIMMLVWNLMLQRKIKSLETDVHGLRLELDREKKMQRKYSEGHREAILLVMDHFVKITGTEAMHQETTRKVDEIFRKAEQWAKENPDEEPPIQIE